MDLIVLIKPVPDLDKIKISRGQGQIFETSKQIMNSYDRVGLQVAADLKKKHGGKVTAISICDTSRTDILREAYALGADICYNLWESSFETNDAYVNTKLLGTAIHKIGPFDLIICGAISDSGFSGQTGPRLAEFLQLPQATAVVKIDLQNNLWTVEKKTGKQQMLSRPALITIDTSAAIPQIPNALNIMKAFKKEVTLWKIADLNLSPEEVGEAGAKVKIRSRFLTEG